MKNHACYSGAYWQPTWANTPATRTYTKPSANIFETETAYVIELAAPGFAKEDFKINIDGKRNLIISVEKVATEDAQEQKYNHQEFRYASFKRVFLLPDNANEKEVVAKYENGILSVNIPKQTVEKKIFEVKVA
jgi:HSP20 family protein